MRTKDGFKVVKAAKPIDELLKVWPWNLAADVMTTRWDFLQRNENRDEAEEEMRRAISLLWVPGFLSAIGDLSERERVVLRLRYQDGLTMGQTAKMFNVTRERIRQIQEKACRKLRHPGVAKKYILIEPEKAEELRKERDKLLLENISLRDKKTPEAKKEEPPKEIYIEEMELSVRSYNCLCRAGVRTLSQLADMKVSDLMKVRNLGRKSMIEIIVRAREFGVIIEDDSGRYKENRNNV